MGTALRPLSLKQKKDQIVIYIREGADGRTVDPQNYLCLQDILSTNPEHCLDMPVSI